MDLNPDIAAVLSGERRWCVVTADCLDVLPTLPDGCVDAVVTDPPYSSGGQFRGDRQQSTRTKYQSGDVIIEHANFDGDSRDQRGWAYWCSLWLGKCLEKARPGAALCMFTDWRQLPSATDAIQSGGWVWRGLVPWDKVNARPQPDRFKAQCEYVVWATNGPREMDYGGTYHPGIVREPAPMGDARCHSTQKPVEAMVPFVRIAAIGGLVIDPFCGSGTTGVAALREGRRVICIEKTEHYADIARRRIAAEDAQPMLIQPGAKAPVSEQMNLV